MRKKSVYAYTVHTTRLLFIMNIVFLLSFIAFFYIPNLGGIAQLPRQERVVSRARMQVHNKIISYTSEYHTRETTFASIRYTAADAPFIDAVEAKIGVFYPLLLQDFGLTFAEAGKLSVIVYPTQQSLESALGRRYTYVPMGVYFGGIINIISPTMWLTGNTDEINERFMREGPMIHEMTHFVLDTKTRGNYPLWFTEGVALYYEYKYAAYEWRPDLRYEASKLCVTEVVNDFRSFNESLSYRKVFDVIMNYIYVHTEYGLQQIITELNGGTPYDEVLAAVLDAYCLLSPSK
jgi:hypothetical protein